MKSWRWREVSAASVPAEFLVASLCNREGFRLFVYLYHTHISLLFHTVLRILCHLHKRTCLAKRILCRKMDCFWMTNIVDVVAIQ